MSPWIALVRSWLPSLNGISSRSMPVRSLSSSAAMKFGAPVPVEP